MHFVNLTKPGGCYKYIPVLQEELLLHLMKRMPNLKHLMSLVEWSKLLKISIDLEPMRAKLWAALYQWETLLFACLKDGREVYNGFCLEAILRLAFHLSKGLLLPPGFLLQNNYIWRPLKVRLFLDTQLLEKRYFSQIYFFEDNIRYLFNFYFHPSSPLFF